MHRASRPFRHFLLAALLALGLVGCGLSDYEALMRDAQAREQRFLEESKLLGPPVTIPKHKVKDQEVPLANVFFRPPLGIGARPEDMPRNNIFYRYTAQGKGEALAVEIVFASDNKDFGKEVWEASGFQATHPVQWQTRQLQPPDRPPLAFNTLEFSDAERSYSINLYQKGQTQVAIVFWLWSPISAQARKVVNLSLESLAVDADVPQARQRYERKTPWQLSREPRP